MLHHHWYRWSPFTTVISRAYQATSALSVATRDAVGQLEKDLANLKARSRAGDLLLGPVVEPLTTKQQADIGQLVGGFKHFLFSIIYGIIIPTDFHIFQRGWNHQLARYFMICLIYTSQEMPWNVPPYPDYGWIYHHYQSLVDIISLYPCMWIYIYIYIQVNISTYVTIFFINPFAVLPSYRPRHRGAPPS